jgi:hypothetical protein
MNNAARAPKELARRSLISSKKQAEETIVKSDDSESPTEYAENRIGEKTKSAADRVKQNTVQGGKRFARKMNDMRRKKKQAMKSTQNVTKNTQKAARGTAKATQKTARAARTSVKTAQKTVKATRAGVKTAQKTVKTAQAATKAAQKGMQAAAKAAQMAAKAAQAAARAAVAAAKAAVKVTIAIIKAIIAAIKALIAAIAAGGWVAVVILIVVVLVIALLSVFGVFSANEASDGSKPMTETIETINAEFYDSAQEKIDELSEGAETVEVIYEGDLESLDSPLPNWSDVIAIYAAKTSLDPENPADVTVVDEENIERLKKVFYDMNKVTYRAEEETETIIMTDETGAAVLDDDGDPVTQEITTRYIYVNVISADYLEAAEQYALTEDQSQMLSELMLPDYYPLFAELLGDTVGDGGEFGFGLNINPDLPPNTLGAQIVAAAKKYIGRSYSSMDCSKLVRTAYNDCGLTSMNGKSSVYMAKACEKMGVLFTDPAQLQAGDLIFFSRYDPGRGPEYCGDIGRCGTGKCKRWMHIHHVAIYINDEFLIDSTGGENSVQIRKHWGVDTAKWKWCCFGRPTT